MAISRPTGPRRMTNAERAKIFSPFNPLAGFTEALRAKEREVELSAEDNGSHEEDMLEMPSLED